MQGSIDKNIFRGRPKKNPIKLLIVAVIGGYCVGVIFYLLGGQQSLKSNTTHPPQIETAKDPTPHTSNSDAEPSIEKPALISE